MASVGQRVCGGLVRDAGSTAVSVDLFGQIERGVPVDTRKQVCDRDRAGRSWSGFDRESVLHVCSDDDPLAGCRADRTVWA